MRQLFPALLLAAACQSAAPAGLTDADKAAIQKGEADAEAHFNAQPADLKAHAAVFYSADAVLMPPNMEPVVGVEAIGNWLAAPKISNTKLAIVDMDGTGSVAYVHGSYEMDITLPGMTAAVHDKGKNLHVWKKQSDGSWKVALDIFNSDLPIPPPPPPAGKKRP